MLRVQERKFLSVSNYFFTVLFTAEMMIKVGDKLQHLESV